MADLVAEHRGELGLRVQVGQQAAVHIDVAAAGREGVDRLVVEHDELELGIRQVADARDTLADFGDVVLHGLVVVDAVGLDDLLIGLAAGLGLALQRARQVAGGLRRRRRRRGRLYRGEQRGAQQRREQQFARHSDPFLPPPEGVPRF